MDYDALISKVFYTTKLKRTVISKFESNIDRYPNIYNYLYRRYPEFYSIRETLYRVYNKLDEPNRCQYCNIPIPYGINMINNFCCDEHRKLSRKEKTKNTCIEKYGVDNPMKDKTICDKVISKKDYSIEKEKRAKTFIEKYGVDNPGKIESTIIASHTKEVCSKQNDSRKKTCQERYGVDNIAQTELSKSHSIETCNERYGVNNVFQSEEVQNKIYNTCLKRYGKKSYQQTEESKIRVSEYFKQLYINNPELREENKQNAILTCQEKYGTDWWTQSEDGKKILSEILCSDEVRAKFRETSINKYGTDHPMKNEDVQNKLIETCKFRYGSNSYRSSQINKTKMGQLMSSDFMQARINETKRKNHTFNSSKAEDQLYELLICVFPDTIRNYRSEKYPYDCDFYIPQLDLYIEYNGTWTHGKHIYDPNNIEDQEKLKLWESKAETSKYYKNAIYTWTDLDIRKYTIAKENDLNYIIFWDKDVMINWIDSIYNIIHNDLTLPIPDIDTELKMYDRRPGNLNSMYTASNIIKYYQQDVFYNVEKGLFKEDPWKIIDNRCRYLNKSIDELTVEDILSGYKKSGIYYGYSHFNPLWFKWFIQKYGCKVCYDPCGGWGHRVLGSGLLDKYIYNDLSKDTYDNVCKMVSELGINNVILYNNDANDFRPIEDYDAMFTCPPYYNVEHYSCGDFCSIEEFDRFIDNLFDAFYSKESCKIFGLVLREDLLPDRYVPVEKYELKIRKASHLLKNNDKKHSEYLYVFTK